MSDTLFLELEDHIGIEPSHYHDPQTGEVKEHPNAGEPGPLVAEGLAYAVPTLVGKEIVGVTRHVTIRPSEHPVGAGGKHVKLDEDVATDARIIPGTRQIETSNAELASILVQAGYRQVDPPKSQHVTRGKSASGEKEEG
jgi:hypothetical protein